MFLCCYSEQCLWLEQHPWGLGLLSCDGVGVRSASIPGDPVISLGNPCLVLRLASGTSVSPSVGIEAWKKARRIGNCCLQDAGAYGERQPPWLHPPRIVLLAPWLSPNPRAESSWGKSLAADAVSLKPPQNNFISSLQSCTSELPLQQQGVFFGELLSACSCMHQMAFELPRCLSNAFSA